MVLIVQEDTKPTSTLCKNLKDASKGPILNKFSSDGINEKSWETLVLTKKQILVCTLGMVLIAVAVVTMAINPVLMIAKYFFRMAPGSYVYGIFQSEVEGAWVSLTIFNITNADRFVSGEDHKLHLNEVGPFTYQEIRTNTKSVLDMENKRVHFVPSLKLKFVPEKSVARPEDVNVTVANTVLLSAASLLRSYPFFIREAFNIISRRYKSKSIITVNADTYLWGLEDPLIKIANTVAPGLIFFDKLGIMDRLYDNKTYFQIELGISDEDKFSIKSLERYLTNKPEDYPPIEKYTFNDTYEGVAYRTDITKDTPLNLYRLGVCKTFELGYHSKVTLDYGPEAFIYKMTNDTFNRDCRAGKGKCGLLDLAPCLFGIPLSLSRTHFLHSDPELYERIEGMKPDENVHDSTFTVDPKIGFELDTHLSLQLNLALGDLWFNREARTFSNLVVPIAHIKVTQPELFDDIKYGLKIIHVIAPTALICLQILIIVIGLLLLRCATRQVLCMWLTSKNTLHKMTSELKEENKREGKQIIPLIKK